MIFQDDWAVQNLASTVCANDVESPQERFPSRFHTRSHSLYFPDLDHIDNVEDEHCWLIEVVPAVAGVERSYTYPTRCHRILSE